MKLKIIIIYHLVLIKVVFAQPADGTLQSLIDAENYFSSIVKAKGQKAAFMKVVDQETLLYRPGLVNAVQYFEQQEADPTYALSWQPSFARIAKSGDWGFTSGPYEIKTKAGEHFYGQYVSVWRVNNKGIWKLNLDAGIPHDKPLQAPDLDFLAPNSRRFFYQRSAKRLAEREDVVLLSDRLLSATLMSKGIPTYLEFLAEDTRLLMPGHEPIRGKQAALDFWESRSAAIITTPEAVDRALSGDWAYTRGKATITLNQQSKDYAYLRIWELQQGFNWNLVLEIFSPLAD